MNYKEHSALIGGAKESVHEAEQCLAAAIVNGADTATKTLCAEVLAAAQQELRAVRSTRVKAVAYPAGTICLA